MPLVSKVRFTERHKSIDVGFDVNLGKVTVITGINNSGKTNFVNGISSGKAQLLDEEGVDITEHIKITYIPAEVVVTDEHFKLTKQSALSKELKDHIVGNPLFRIEPEDETNNKTDVVDLFSIANQKLRDLLSYDPERSVIQLGISETIGLKEILDQIIEIKPSDSPNGVQHRDFKDLGQGWQRLIIVSFILASSEKKASDDTGQLIIIEEPEIYLHPKLKKAINGMLKGIAEKSGYRVIMTTHDPYFAMSNKNDGNTVYSFSLSDGGDTVASQEGVISGVEDELLHIFLFSRVVEKARVAGVNMNNGMGETGGLNTWLIEQNPTLKEYVWDNDHVLTQMSLPLCVRHIIHHPENRNTVNGSNVVSGTELEDSIRILNTILSS